MSNTSPRRKISSVGTSPNSSEVTMRTDFFKVLFLEYLCLSWHFYQRLLREFILQSSSWISGRFPPSDAFSRRISNFNAFYSLFLKSGVFFCSALLCLNSKSNCQDLKLSSFPSSNIHIFQLKAQHEGNMWTWLRAQASVCFYKQSQ